MNGLLIDMIPGGWSSVVAIFIILVFILKGNSKERQDLKKESSVPVKVPVPVKVTVPVIAPVPVKIPVAVPVSVSAKIPVPVSVPVKVSVIVFYKTGDLWDFGEKDKKIIKFVDSVGMQYLYDLISSPGYNFTPIQLISAGKGEVPSAAGLLFSDMSSKALEEYGLTLDDEIFEGASNKYRIKTIDRKIKGLKKITKFLEEKNMSYDLSEKLDDSNEHKITELKDAILLLEEEKKQIDINESKRPGITRALDRALKKIRKAARELEDRIQLKNTIHKGNKFSYDPDPLHEVEWILSPDDPRLR